MLVLFTDLVEAGQAASQAAETVGIDYVLVERLPVGPLPRTEWLSDDITGADHRYTILPKVEWDKIGTTKAATEAGYVKGLVYTVARAHQQ